MCFHLSSALQDSVSLRRITAQVSQGYSQRMSKQDYAGEDSNTFKREFLGRKKIYTQRLSCELWGCSAQGFQGCASVRPFSEAWNFK